MFRIFVATGRLTQRRSPSTLRYPRPFYSTVWTRQSSSAAEKPVGNPAKTSQPSVNPGNSDPLPSLSTSSTSSSDSRANDPADPKTKLAKPQIPRTRNTSNPDDGTAKSASSKDIKRRASRRQKKYKIPEGIREPTSSEQQPYSTASRNHSEIDQSENPSPASESTTVIENRYRKKPFTSRNVRDDVLAYLRWARGGYPIGKSIGDNRRLNIISKPLCDDIIKRLEPSLQKHIGCDIIDVNPGVGIWSETLHDFLKPRTHILLEPDQTMYQPLLQPLLDAPGSTYKLLSKSGIIWGHLEKVLSKEYLPKQEAFERGDPRLEKQNDSLLFVANLGYHPRRTYRGFSSLANLVLYQLLSAVRAHSLFQRYGRVRMLIWLDSEERSTVLPRTISLRRKSAIEAEISCEKIHDVASSTDEVGNFRREHHLELESTRLVYEKMKEKGVSMPKDRESTFLKLLHSEKSHDVREKVFTRAFLEELDDLETRLAAGEFTEEVEVTKRSPGQRGRSFRKIDPRLARLRTCRWRYNAELAKYQASQEVVREFKEIFALQREVQVAKTSERYVLEKELEQRTHAWKRKFNAIPDQDPISVMLDNIRAFETKPPTLMFDRRDYEPLKVCPGEFYPQQEMCLLDLQPKSLWPILQERFPENYDVLEYIIGQLSIIPTQTIKRGFSALAPGAYDYLITECPSLTDPTKGGSVDVELMPVRRLTEEMLKEIVEAWARWPFKPDRYELMRRMGSSVFDPDALDIDDSG